MAPWIRTKSTAHFDRTPFAVDLVYQRHDELGGAGRAAEARIRVIDGRDGAGVESIRIERRGGRVVTSADMRELDLEKWAIDAISDHETVMQPRRPERGDVVAIEPDRRAVEDRVHGSKRATAPDVLRRVAEVFLDPANRVDAEGGTIARNRRRPTERVRVEVLGENVSLRSASRRVEDARKAGLIPSPEATDEELDAAYARLMEGESHGEAS